MSREALQVQQGSLYPELHRLEYKKFLKATWKESETGREAKFYELTVQGRAHLKAETENWNRLKSQLYELSPLDPAAIFIAIAAVSSMTLAAAWLPAKRAAKINLVRALRAE